MDGIFKKALFCVSICFSSMVFANAETQCIKHEDLTRIAQDFDQFQKFVGNKTEYCQADLGEHWFEIGQSLDVLMNMEPNEPLQDMEDGFTYKAIAEKDWWAYFTKRASRFEVQNNCPANVVAYVQPFFGQGVINLCLLFFEQSISSQASVMMHEVRHFDGHRHVTCAQGNEKGSRGACDNRISGKGSYAISVQTLVGMARSEVISPAEKPIIEAEAVYMAFNKFNEVPKVKLKNSLVLSSNSGEVHNWSLDQGVELVAQLPEPSIVLNSANNLTLYPLDVESKAYRQDRNLEVKLDNPGLYAQHYNGETAEERLKYKSISYFATGGLLKDNSLLTLCNRKSSELSPTSLDDKGQFVSIISISLDEKDQTRESLLLAESGELYRYECENSSSDQVNFEKLTEVVEGGGAQIVDSFGFDGKQYALMKDGSLSTINFRGNSLILSPLNFPGLNQQWVSATPLSLPEVF